jgi:hypothetical protein
MNGGMSMADYEPDRDYGDETAHLRVSSGLCERCHEDAALPADDYCADCAGDIALALEEAVSTKLLVDARERFHGPKGCP